MTDKAISEKIAALTESCKRVGRLEALLELRRMGEIHVLAPDVSEAELVAALSAHGLAISTIDNAQLIHRMPAEAPVCPDCNDSGYRCWRCGAGYTR